MQPECLSNQTIHPSNRPISNTHLNDDDDNNGHDSYDDDDDETNGTIVIIEVRTWSSFFFLRLPFKQVRLFQI